MHAMSGGLSSLGDAAAATEPAPGGGGVLTGIARTLQARGKRMAGEKQQQFQNEQEVDKNKALVAEANARMVHEQTLTHQLGQESIASSVAAGNKNVDFLKKQSHPGTELVSNVTADDMKSGKHNPDGSITINGVAVNPTTDTPYPTGQKVIGTDKDGNPQYATTYTWMKLPSDVTLTEDHKSKLSEWDRYAPRSDGGKWQVGQNLTGAQWNVQEQAVEEGRAGEAARKRILEDNEIEDTKRADTLETIHARPEIVSALAANSNDPMAALRALQQTGRFPNAERDMSSYMGEKEWGEVRAAYDKKANSTSDDLDEISKKLPTAHGEEAASMAADLQSRLSDKTNIPSPQNKAKIQTMLTRANAQTKASVDFAASKKQQETKAEQDANEGDMSGIKDMVLSYDYDPNNLFSRFKDQKQKRDFIAEIRKTDPTWSEANYKARYATNQDFRPEGKGGVAKQSLNTFAGHIGDANNLISTLGNTKSPLLNTPLNKIKEDVLGKPEFIAYRTAIAAAADNYIDFLLNQKAKHQSDDDLAARLQSTSTSPAGAQAMMRQMANTVAIRGRALNKGYRDQMGGKDIPNFLDPDTEQVLQTFGINPKSITAQGTSGLIPNGVKQGTVPGGARPIMKGGQTVGYLDQNGKRVNF
jgi:hypothetical protein